MEGLKLLKQTMPRREVYSVIGSKENYVVFERGMFFVTDGKQNNLTRGYEKHISSKNGMHVFGRSGGIYVVNSRGDEVLKGLQYARIEDDVIVVGNDNNWGLANYKGEIIVKPFANCIGNFDKAGHALFSIDSKSVYLPNYWGIMNKSGSYVIPPVYYQLLVRTNGIIAKVHNYGCIDINNNIIEEFKYNKLKMVKNSLIIYETKASKEEFFELV